MNAEDVFGPVKTNATYFYLAKLALWITSTTLLVVFVWALRRFIYLSDQSVIGYLISCAQVLSFIAISVMGYHLSGRNKKVTKEMAADVVEDNT